MPKIEVITSHDINIEPIIVHFKRDENNLKYLKIMILTISIWFVSDLFLNYVVAIFNAIFFKD